MIHVKLMVGFAITIITLRILHLILSMSWGFKAEGSFRGTSAKTVKGGIQAECRLGTISLQVSKYNNLPKLVPCRVSKQQSTKLP